jgi:hypothetical protein
LKLKLGVPGLSFGPELKGCQFVSDLSDIGIRQSGDLGDNFVALDRIGFREKAAQHVCERRLLLCLNEPAAPPQRQIESMNLVEIGRRDLA